MENIELILTPENLDIVKDHAASEEEIRIVERKTGSIDEQENQIAAEDIPNVLKTGEIWEELKEMYGLEDPIFIEDRVLKIASEEDVPADELQESVNKQENTEEITWYYNNELLATDDMIRDLAKNLRNLYGKDDPDSE